MIVEVMEDNNIHVLSVSETHLRQGSNEDLACPRLIKPGLNHLRYEPLLPIHLYLDNEREWILIHENNSNVEICFVYLAAEVGGENYDVWNAKL